jgi:hypothetical protein
MLEFLNPGALWALAAVPLVYMLNMYRHRRLRVRVSSSLIWREVLEKHPGPPRSARRFINLQLLIEIAVVILLAAALAAPVVKGPEPGEWKVLVLDASCRMKALSSNGESRFDSALKAAEEEIRGIGGSGRAVLFVSGGITGGARLGAVLKPGEALDALEKIKPSDAPADVDEILNSAAALAAKENASLVLLSDKAANLPPELAPLLRIRHPFEPAGNVGLTALGVRDNAVLATVSKFGPQPASAILTVEGDCGGILHEETLDLPAGNQTREILFRTDADINGARLIEARIKMNSGGNALKSDDAAFAFKFRRGGLKIALSGNPPKSVERALRAAAGAGEIVMLTDGDAPDSGFDLYVYAGALPRLDPHGAAILINPPAGEMRGIALGGSAAALRGNPVPGAPLGAEVEYRIESPFQVRLAEGEGIRPVVAAVLENGSQVPAVLLKDDPSGALAAVLFDADESGWARDASFPVFFAEFFDYVLETGAGEWRTLRTGGILYAGSRITGGKTVDSQGTARSIPPSETGTFKADAAGRIELETAGGTLVFGASVLDASESDTSLKSAETASAEAQAPKRAGEEPQELWRFCMMAAIALILLHWMLSQGRELIGEKRNKA